MHGNAAHGNAGCRLLVGIHRNAVGCIPLELWSKSFLGADLLRKHHLSLKSVHKMFSDKASS